MGVLNKKNDNKRMLSLTDLPNELRDLIRYELDSDDIVLVYTTCKELYEEMKERYFWKRYGDHKYKINSDLPIYGEYRAYRIIEYLRYERRGEFNVYIHAGGHKKRTEIMKNILPDGFKKYAKEDMRLVITIKGRNGPYSYIQIYDEEEYQIDDEYSSGPTNVVIDLEDMYITIWRLCCEDSKLLSDIWQEDTW